jgi:hypothetical protein
LAAIETKFMTETEKIQKQLKIPIDNINFHSNYVDILINGEKVGSLPYYEVNGIKTYDTDEKIVNNLNWSLVYIKHKFEIDKKIKELLEKNSPYITIGSFRRLYIKDSNEDFICTINCEFEEEWTVCKE